MRWPCRPWRRRTWLPLADRLITFIGRAYASSKLPATSKDERNKWHRFMSIIRVSTEMHHICHRQGSRRLTLRQLFWRKRGRSLQIYCGWRILLTSLRHGGGSNWYPGFSEWGTGILFPNLILQQQRWAYFWTLFPRFDGWSQMHLYLKGRKKALFKVLRQRVNKDGWQRSLWLSSIA